MQRIQSLLLAWSLALLDSAVYRIGIVRSLVSQKIPVPRTFEVGHDSGGTPFVQDPKGEKIFLSSMQRVSMYRRGVEHRIRDLFHQYGLSEILSSGVDTFVDVGANIGEFGVGLRKGLMTNYVAIEPDPIAFGALSKNCPGGLLINEAAADFQGMATLYLDTDKADSSLQPQVVPSVNQVSAVVTTVDKVLEDAGISRIDVLKVEAEGSEPEVLRGASRTLRNTYICVVDAGPERQGRSTAPECIEILQKAGFVLVDLRFPRGILVFSRKARPDTPKPQYVG